MSLKKRLQIFVFVIIFATILVSSIGITSVLYSKVVNMESTLITNDLNRAQEFFKNEASNLNVTVKDWAIWDDTYNYMEDRNEAYVSSNLTESAIETLEIYSLILLENDGSVATSVTTNTDNVAHQIELDLITTQFNQIINLKNTNDLNGILNIRNNSYVFAINEITNSDATAETNGYLLMLKEVGTGIQDGLSQLVDHKVIIEEISIEDITSTEDYVIEPADLTMTDLSGYTIIKDSYNKPVLKVTVIHERFLLAQANTTLPMIFVLLVFVAIVSGGAYYWFMQNDIVRNLNGITKYIQTIIAKETINSTHPKLTGDFSKVADVLTKMSQDLAKNERELEAKNLLLENANKELEAQKQQLAKSNSDLQEMNNSMVGRETKMIELKNEIEALKSQINQS